MMAEFNKKITALTFDDGPDVMLTNLILDKLDKFNVPATFMAVGQRINDTTSSVIKRMVNSGHELGNHSWGYSSMGDMSKEEIKESVSKTTAAIESYSGTSPKFFRAPNLVYSKTLYDNVDLVFAHGITANDWVQTTTAQQRADEILRQIEDGAIILLHDVQPLPHPTPEALDIIIPELKDQGYEFVTLSDLFLRRGLDLSACKGKVYSVVP
jgi:peptidoglycan/xylan/chitin deacetylase (PgdA/CDA1 family)